MRLKDRIAIVVGALSPDRSQGGPIAAQPSAGAASASATPVSARHE